MPDNDYQTQRMFEAMPEEQPDDDLFSGFPSEEEIRAAEAGFSTAAKLKAKLVFYAFSIACTLFYGAKDCRNRQTIIKALLFAGAVISLIVLFG